MQAIALFLFVASLPVLAALQPAEGSPPTAVPGFRDFAAESKIENQFLAVPDAQLAGQDLKTLTAEPHVAATPEDYKTALYVAKKFRDAGLDTQIVPYRVLLNWPKKVQVTAYAPDGKVLMTGPTPEHVAGDPAADNPRVVMPFNSSSASGDVTGEVVYANYGRRKTSTNWPRATSTSTARS